ncbi:hypothetical protein P6U16_13430 [Rhizobium sp. 32-5/1]|uniref:hypothetical protein n=1 Tax=Rhizobium sp. 32-5/1 TaxID=3019602 RepID=UPI00240E3B62|nr:hypothetical protein [Rhizobium sp. 32-5/1]WEZ82179.1 hypothetical protein P6U16_13430 [Rhizobium sp. 32-5/1]
MPRSMSIDQITDEAERLIFQFCKIANVSEISLSFEMGLALSTFRRVALTHQIDGNVGRRMLDAAILAHATAAARLPATFDREILNIGMRAVAGLIVVWTEPETQRSVRSADVCHDMRDHLRILCNCIDNADLQDRINERKHARIRQAVNQLQRIAG